MSHLPQQFLNLLKKKPLIVGVGNTLRGDDGLGVYLLEQLKGKIQADFLDVGVAPENYLAKIVKFKPRTIIFLDAVDLGEAFGPGAMRILEAEELAEGGISTHALSPGMVIDYLKKDLKDVKIFMLGVQPRSCGLGEGLSQEVKVAIEEFLKELKKGQEEL